MAATGYGEIVATADHARALERLPLLHRGPFDRVLIAPARAEGVQFVTADQRVAQYGEGVQPV